MSSLSHICYLYVYKHIYKQYMWKYSRMLLKFKKYQERFQKEKQPSFPKYYVSAFMPQKVTGITKQNEPFSCIL